MTTEQFDNLCETLNRTRTAIIMSKRPEYTEGHADILNNFKVVAAELGLTPLQVWYVYFRKHVASIGQFCADDSRKLSEPITGRICDAMNYLELLHALVKEKEKQTIEKVLVTPYAEPHDSN